MLRAGFIAAVFAAGLSLTAESGLRVNSTPAGLPTIDNAYWYMYNLQFAEAHQTLRAWHAAHPDDPMGPASEAAAYLFNELERLHVLQSEFFTHDAEFRSGAQLPPDPRSKQEFLTHIAAAQRLAAAALARNPKDSNAELANILADGLRSDYLALVEKRYIAAVSYMKKGRVLAQALLAHDPSMADAYVAIGIENYMLGIKPAPVRWMLAVTGGHTDSEQGIRELTLTAERGRFFQPFARLLLAVAALRSHDKGPARELLAGLAKEFPRNRLYARELARLK